MIFTIMILFSSFAFGAWPDSFAHRIAAMEALRYDLAMPGVPYQEEQVRSRYTLACELKYYDVCKPEKWLGKNGGDAEKALKVFEGKCNKSKSPLACVVTGFGYGMVNEEISAEAKNPKRAFAAFATACNEKAYGPGCTYLGDMYAKGVGVDLDPVRAEKYYKEACKAKDIWGCHRLADLYRDLGKNEAEQLTYYEKSCNQGYALGCISKAVVMMPKARRETDWQFIAGQLEVACRYGQTARCADLAGLYQRGKGVRRSLETARALYQSTCTAGVASSCHEIGQIYLEMSPPQFETAAKTFFDACEGGYSPSCTRYGALAISGQGVEQNLVFGLRYMNKGCEAGDLEGCLALAEAYSLGEGLEKDVEKAKKLATDTCEGGYARGCYALARLVEQGKVWGQDDSQAPEELYEKSCTMGDGRGCSEIALRAYSKGNATVDIQQKLDIGCAGDDVRACLALGDIFRGMDAGKSMDYWLRGCELNSMDACLAVAKEYLQRQKISQAASYYERVCNLGDERGCQGLDPIAFQGKFSEIVQSAFLTNLCQVWARPDNEDFVLLADAKGAQINLYSGNYSGSSVSVWHIGETINLDGVQRGESRWNVGGILPKADNVWGSEDAALEQQEDVSQNIWSQEKISDWEFNLQHVEEWDPSKGSVSRNFPENEAQAFGDKGVLYFYRDSGEINAECMFPLRQETIYSEHCSEIQSLIIGYSLMDCSVPKTENTYDDSYFYE